MTTALVRVQALEFLPREFQDHGKYLIIALRHKNSKYDTNIVHQYNMRYWYSCSKFIFDLILIYHHAQALIARVGINTYCCLSEFASIVEFIALDQLDSIYQSMHLLTRVHIYRYIYNCWKRSKLKNCIENHKNTPQSIKKTCYNIKCTYKYHFTSSV